jgi:hypothetical protein
MLELSVEDESEAKDEELEAEDEEPEAEDKEPEAEDKELEPNDEGLEVEDDEDHDVTTSSRSQKCRRTVCACSRTHCRRQSRYGMAGIWL